MAFPVLLYLLLQGFLLQDQWRFVLADGSVQVAWGEVKRTEAERAQLRAAWVWSEVAAPLRVEPAQIGRGGGGPAASSWLAVRVAPERVARGSGPLPAGLRVVAAPVEMWREIPEHLLPSWPVPPRGNLFIPVDASRSWRLRLAGAGQGSWWVDVPAGARSALLAARAAPGVDMAVSGPDGKPLPGVQALALEGTGRQTGNRFWALERGEAGTLALPGLPDFEEITLTLTYPGLAPAILRGRPGDLPHAVRLGRGAVLSGRLVDEAKRPVPDAAVEVEAWASAQAPQLVRLQTASGGDGAWSLAGAPPGKAVLTIRSAGRAVWRETLDLVDGRNDLGVLVLAAGRSLRVRVVDDLGEGVAGAQVQAGAGINARTDARGLARLTGLPAGAPLEIRATAERHRPGRTRVSPPLPEAVRLELGRAFTLQGRLLESPGVPVSEGTARFEQGGTSLDQAIGTDGGFAIDLAPGSAASPAGSLVLTSPSTRELRLTVEPGSPGEVRDLGDLLAPAGTALTGRVVRARDGSPVARARVWLPRPGPAGAVLAWAAGDLLQAWTGEDGRFRLGALAAGPALLRADAPGLARAYLEVAVSEAEAAQEIGDVLLGEGSTLRVLAPDSEEGAVARADLRGDWLEPDLLTAPLRDGEARIRQVPAGPARVTVLAGRRLLCEQEVEVPEGPGEIDVDCRRPALQVSGVVRVGAVPAGPGLLTWMPPAPALPSRIDTTISPGGLRQQQVFGAGRPSAEVPVAADGTFFTEDLSPGPWQVRWSPDEGSFSGSLEVVIPAVERYQTVLTFPGLAVRGRVVHEKTGEPAEGARVRDLATGTLAFSTVDGSFILAGLPPGRIALQARFEEEASAVVEVDLTPENPPDEVVLSLGARPAAEVEVQVLSADGAPVGGAFVFLEEAGKGLRILTTAADGRASATVEPPVPERLRAAATTGSAWAFGNWAAWQTGRNVLPLSFEPGGSLTVTSQRQEGSPRILTPGGWDLSWLLTLLGNRPVVAPDRPVVVTGLPAGSYRVSLEQSEEPARVREAEPATVDFP